jgi:hypothetical protein
VQIDAALRYLKLVKYPVIADPQFALRPALQSLVGKGFQARAHFIHFALHGFADDGRKIVKGAGKGGRPDLERGGHDSLGLARRVIPGGDFAAGLIELGFHLVLQFKLIFEKVINPRAELLDLRAGQARNGSFNFLNCTHGRKITSRRAFAKAVFPVPRDGKLPSVMFVLTLALIPAFSPGEKVNPSPLPWKIVR